MGTSPIIRYKIRKLDPRSKAYGVYEYQIQFWSTRNYLEIRSWCWDTWGSSCEYELLRKSYGADEKYFNDSWCFQTDPEVPKYCVYIKDDPTLMLFKLRWTGPERGEETYIV